MQRFEPLGQIALHQQLGLRVPEPQHQSFEVPKRRPRELEGPWTREFFATPVALSGKGSLDQLRFALKREPLDCGVLAAAFEQLDERELAAWIRCARPRPATSPRRLRWSSCRA